MTGIYTHSYDLNLSKKSGFPVFGTLIEANYIQKRQDQFSVHRLTDDDRREILALGRDPQVCVDLSIEIHRSTIALTRLEQRNRYMYGIVRSRERWRKKRRERRGGEGERASR